MNPLKKFLLLASMTLSLYGYGQQKMNYNGEKEPDELIIEPFVKKFRWGVTSNFYFTTITGDNLPATYFSKPSLGFNIRAEYFFKQYIGLGVGAGFQQRGTGIINPDNVKGLGNTDSTNLERLRFNTIEVPISLLLRTPKDIVKGVRLSGTFGLVPLINFESNDVFSSPTDGNHMVTPVSDQYQKSDLLYQFSLGPDINAGNLGIFRVHFVYSKGTSNVYSNDIKKGYNQSLGFQVSWLF
jgi:Outer membrane protein beta-barrel domain